MEQKRFRPPLSKDDYYHQVDSFSTDLGRMSDLRTIEEESNEMLYFTLKRTEMDLYDRLEALATVADFTMNHLRDILPRMDSAQILQIQLLHQKYAQVFANALIEQAKSKGQ